MNGQWSRSNFSEAACFPVKSSWYWNGVSLKLTCQPGGEMLSPWNGPTDWTPRCTKCVLLNFELLDDIRRRFT